MKKKDKQIYIQSEEMHEQLQAIRENVKELMISVLDLIDMIDENLPCNGDD